MNIRSRNPNIGLAIGLAVIMLAVVMLSLMAIQMPAQAAPPAAPTPKVTGYSNDTISPPKLFFANGATLTQSTNTESFQLAEAEALDIHLVLVGATDENTVTVKLQHSNDNTNWVDGATIGAVVTTTNSLDQYANFGYYTRINVAPTTTDTVTISHLSAVARR
jgi:hypothetical protein